MCSAGTKSAVVLSLIVVLVLGLALPGQAGYTKLYRFRNLTGVGQTSVRAVANGLETITYDYCGLSSWRPATSGYAVISGVFGTTLTYDGPSLAPNGRLAIGWRTADGSYRLRDLRWGGGQAIVPAQLDGVPGGGMVFYDYPDPGCLTVVITNDLGELGDPEPVIDLADVEFGVAGYELSLEELVALGDLVELRVADIDDDIDTLAAEVEYYLTIGEISGPSANSLLKKLGRAVAYKHDGLDEYLAGDPDRALVFWAKAAKQMTNFISEVTASAQKGNLELDLYNRWVVDGDGEIVPAPDVREALLALPEGQALQSLDPLPAGTPLPAYPGLDPLGYVQWPVDALSPGQYTAFVVCDLDLGSGFIMGGSVVDEAGNVLLEWLEQSVAEPGVIDNQPPKITAAAATPKNLWPPDHEFVDMALAVTVEDDTYAVWYVAGVASNQPILGTGDGDYAPDWVLDPTDPQSVQLRSERSGNHPEERRIYTIILMAIDTAGNLSEPYELVIPVEHDQG
jgi:hypothetical protein